MAEQRHHEADDFLVADKGDPKLSVHALSEFVFCPRAGLCLYEQDRQYDEPEEEADLYFLPMHEHLEWKLGGKPWRVLEYGDLRIPVFKHRRHWKDLYRQHFVRMVAYCRLIETAEGFRSPYGVIIKGETFAAVTVPNTPRTRAMFREALPAARQTICDSEEVNRYPPKPEHEGVCEHCHLAWRTRLHRRNRYLRHGVPIEPKPVPGARGAAYHSHCGDRFRWTPPFSRSRQ